MAIWIFLSVASIDRDYYALCFFGRVASRRSIYNALSVNCSVHIFRIFLSESSFLGRTFFWWLSGLLLVDSLAFLWHVIYWQRWTICSCPMWMDLWLSFGSALTCGSCVCFRLGLLSALWVLLLGELLVFSCFFSAFDRASLFGACVPTNLFFFTPVACRVFLFVGSP